MAVPTVLLYNLDSEKGRKIKVLGLTMKLRVRTVSPAEYGIPLSELLQGTGEKGEAGEPFSEEMLLMAYLTGGQMNSFLQSFPRKKIAPVALKAVLTPTNSAWNSRKLREELLREHEAIAAGKTVHEAEAFKNESFAGNS